MSRFIHSPEPRRVSLHVEPGEASLAKPPPLQKLPGSYSHLWENTLSLHTAHTHRHTQTHRHRHTHTDTDTHTQTHTDRHTHRDTHTDTHTETHTQKHTHRHTHTDTLIHRHTHTDRDIHTYTHTVLGGGPLGLPTCFAYNRCSIPADLLRISCRADAT